MNDTNFHHEFIKHAIEHHQFLVELINDVIASIPPDSITELTAAKLQALKSAIDGNGDMLDSIRLTEKD